MWNVGWIGGFGGSWNVLGSVEDVSGSGGVDILGGVRDTWGVGGMQGIGGGWVTLGTGVIGGRWGIGLLTVWAE